MSQELRLAARRGVRVTPPRRTHSWRYLWLRRGCDTPLADEPERLRSTPNIVKLADGICSLLVDCHGVETTVWMVALTQRGNVSVDANVCRKAAQGRHDDVTDKANHGGLSLSDVAQSLLQYLSDLGVIPQ